MFSFTNKTFKITNETIKYLLFCDCSTTVFRRFEKKQAYIKKVCMYIKKFKDSTVNTQNDMWENTQVCNDMC